MHREEIKMVSHTRTQGKNNLIEKLGKKLVFIANKHSTMLAVGYFAFIDLYALK